MKERPSSEKGQALVLLVLAFVVLLGFTALAIDGSMVYADRRHAQNASDAASLAGASAAASYLENYYVDYEDFGCVTSDPIVANKLNNAMTLARSAAIDRAASNDFSIDNDASDNNGVTTSCQEVDTGTWVDKYLDVTTLITADTRTNFAHFVYSGPVRNTVNAVARLRPRVPMGLGYAVVALRQDCPNTSTGGIHFDGNAVVTVNGGGVFSNACMVGQGSVTVNVPEGLVCTGDGCYTENGSPNISPAPVEGTTPLPTYSHLVPAPDCSTLPNRGNHSGGGTIEEGVYGRIRVTSASANLVLSPGLYCINGEFTMNGGTVSVAPMPDGYQGGVTIYMIGGDFTVNGNVTVNLTAPPNEAIHDCPYCPEAISGLLIYMDPNNEGTVYVTGGSGSYYVGTVYAPSGTIEAGGDAMDEVNAQLIGETVFIHGNTTVNVNIESTVQFRPPASMELAR